MTVQTRVSSLFPSFALPKLGRMHGRKWARLVSRIADLDETHPEHMAYTLMIRRLAHLSGHAGLCVMPGCVTCALEILERYQGSERDLLEEYRHTLAEVKSFMAGLEQLELVA